MVDYYSNTRQFIDRYNEIQEKIKTNPQPTDSTEDEFMTNQCLYLAHALIKDVGYGSTARDELVKTADIINDVLR